MSFHNKLKDLIILFEKWLPDPEHTTDIQEWKESATSLAHSFDFSTKEQPYIHRMIEMYEEQFTQIHHFNHTNKIIESDVTIDNYIKDTIINENIMDKKDDIVIYMDELLQRKQTEQRTPEWYAQMSTIISASELGNLFGSPYQRGKYVLSKTLPYQPRNQQLAVLSERMSAFDWGIRFEPVVKQIYEFQYQTIVKELGRLIHPIESRCSASPDGLVYHCPNKERVGRLIEIKCPVTREIDGIIPKDYYHQMQMQLHVTGLQSCDYIEAVFASKYNVMEQKEGPGCYHGIIALVRYSELKNGQEYYYCYSPINAMDDWKPELKEDEEIVEFIPWRLLQWSEQIVHRNEEWWCSLQPKIELFWEDVEKAKRGEFIPPESTRIKRKKEETCMIVFHKLDENGQGSPLKKPHTASMESNMELDDNPLI